MFIPAPAAAPFTAAITGCRIVRIFSTAPMPERSNGSSDSLSFFCRPSQISFRSPPAQNPLPAPRDHHRMNLLIDADRRQRLVQRRRHLRFDGVHPIWTIQREGRQPVLDGLQQGAFGFSCTGCGVVLISIHLHPRTVFLFFFQALQ